MKKVEVKTESLHELSEYDDCIDSLEYCKFRLKTLSRKIKLELTKPKLRLGT